MIASDFKNNILKLKFNDYIARSEDVCFKNICIIIGRQQLDHFRTLSSIETLIQLDWHGLNSGVLLCGEGDICRVFSAFIAFKETEVRKQLISALLALVNLEKFYLLNKMDRYLARKNWAILISPVVISTSTSSCQKNLRAVILFWLNS